MCSGLTSIATQSRVAAENIGRLAGLGGRARSPCWRSASWSSWAASSSAASASACGSTSLCTTIEALGLVLVIGAGISYWGSADLFEIPPAADGGRDGLSAVFVMQAAVLTFFSFIGFEDMLNVSEEVKNPERTVPHGADPRHARRHRDLHGGRDHRRLGRPLARARRRRPGPLTEVMARAAPAFPEFAFIGITIFAVANTALLNWVMASRLAYGMAQQGLLPAAARPRPSAHPHAPRRDRRAVRDRA